MSQFNLSVLFWYACFLPWLSYLACSISQLRRAIGEAAAYQRKQGSKKACSTRLSRARERNVVPTGIVLHEEFFRRWEACSCSSKEEQICGCWQDPTTYIVNHVDNFYNPVSIRVLSVFVSEVSPEHKWCSLTAIVITQLLLDEQIVYYTLCPRPRTYEAQVTR